MNDHTNQMFIVELRLLVRNKLDQEGRRAMKIRQMNTFLQHFERSDVFMAPKVRNRVK